MSLQMSAPTPVRKASPIRPRQKYSAARAFYLTILVISAIATLSLLKERNFQYGIDDANQAFFRRSYPKLSEGFPHGSSGALVRRDEAVR